MSPEGEEFCAASCLRRPKAIRHASFISLEPGANPPRDGTDTYSKVSLLYQDGASAD